MKSLLEKLDGQNEPFCFKNEPKGAVGVGLFKNTVPSVLLTAFQRHIPYATFCFDLDYKLGIRKG